MEALIRNFAAVSHDSNRVILNKRLHKAVVRNDMKDIQRLIDLGADVNAEFTAGEIINYEIIDADATSIINKDFRFRKITGMYTDVSGNNPDTTFKLSPLQLAIMYGWKEVIIELIRKGANPNTALDVNNRTILHLMFSIAAIFKNENSSVKFDREIIQLLLDHGADPNIQDDLGRTSLHAAVNFTGSIDNAEYVKGIEQILINGANPEIKDRSGTVLWYKLEDIEYDTEPQRTIKLILDHEANPKDCDLSVEFKQHMKKNSQLIEAIKSKEKSKVSRLVNEGTSPNIRDKDGLSALHLAVKLGDYAIAELLLNKGANPNIKSWKNGTTPLFNAVTTNRMNIAELLLKHTANPSVINTKGLSPLYFTITNNNEEMTQLLLKYKANPDISRQVSILFNVLNGVKNDNDIKVIENTLKKLKDIAEFLKSKDIAVDYSLFYQSVDIAEKRDKKNTAKKVMDLLDELTSPM